MRFAVVASALFAGFVAASPVVTETIQATETDTITSCAASVTNCPARSTSSSAISTSVPIAIFPANVTSSAGHSTVTLYSTQEITITSCAPTVTNCPARTSVTSFAIGTTVIPVAGHNGGSSIPAPFPLQNSTAVYQPTGTGSVGTASAGLPSASYTGVISTGAASGLQAGMGFAAAAAGLAVLLI